MFHESRFLREGFFVQWYIASVWLRVLEANLQALLVAVVISWLDLEHENRLLGGHNFMCSTITCFIRGQNVNMGSTIFPGVTVKVLVEGVILKNTKRYW